MVGKHARTAMAVLGLSFAAACATAPGPAGLAPSVQVMQGNLPQPGAGQIPSSSLGSYVAPGDRLKIDVFGVPDLQRDITVDEAGRISYPLVGTLSVAGLTSTAVAEEIQSRLAGGFVKNPQVTVNIEESANRLVTVDGEVNKPGMYPVLGKMTLVRAVAVAGGTSEFAKLNDVIIRREVGGQTYLALYNLGAIRRGNYEDPEIFPSDVIEVGDSKSRRLFKDILQVVPLATTPLILLLERSGSNG